MIVARVIVLFAGLLVALGVAAYILTGNKRYLTFSWRVFLATLAALVVFFAVLILERVLLI